MIEEGGEGEKGVWSLNHLKTFESEDQRNHELKEMYPRIKCTPKAIVMTLMLLQMHSGRFWEALRMQSASLTPASPMRAFVRVCISWVTGQ